jgi:hypothetical protein
VHLREKLNSSLSEDEDGFDAGPEDPDYSKHGFVWFHEKAKLYQSKGVQPRDESI